MTGANRVKEEQDNMATDELPATDAVTNMVSEQLQLSGERDRLKHILLEDLRSHGWTEAMFKTASKAVNAHQVEHETVGSGSGKARQALTARQLADLIAKPAHGMTFFIFIFWGILFYIYLTFTCFSHFLVYVCFSNFHSMALALASAENVPDAVRTRLMQKLIVFVRDFVADGAYPSAVGCKDATTKPEDFKQ